MESSLDLPATHGTLTSWLADRVEAPVVLSEITVPGHGGFSHDTLLCEAQWGGEAHRLVVRVEPGEHAIFPRYDLEAQYRTLARLATGSGVPVPAVRWFEADPGVLGRRFFVMDRVDGTIPADNPPFLMTGWLHDASPEAQHAAQASVIDTLAAIHRADGAAADLEPVLAPDAPPGLGRELRVWGDYLDWAEADGALPVIRAAFDWCASHRPQPEPAATLGWGDARYGNIVFGDDFRVRAVLDWEMATIAPPEVDLGWFCFIHDTTRMFFDDLPGFVDRPRWLGRYATALGRDVDDLRWYEAWAGVRAAAIQAQMVRRAFERGDAADLRGREEANPVVASLRRVLPDI